MAENDRIQFGTNEMTGEPSYLYGDAPVAVIGGSGSGKSTLLREVVKGIDAADPRRPQIVIDLKPKPNIKDDFYQVVQLSQVLESAGICDKQGEGCQPSVLREGFIIGKYDGRCLIADYEPRSYKSRRFMDIVRALVLGSIRSLSGRNGVLHLDEAWMAGLAEDSGRMKEILAEAHEGGVQIFFYTGRSEDLFGKQSARGVVLSNTNQADAESALSMLGIEPTIERVARVTGGGVVGDFPNYNSLRHQAESGNNSRGTVGYYLAPDGSVQTAIIGVTA